MSSHHPCGGRENESKGPRYCFEVVESEFVEDYNHLAKILEHYRSKGYQTALDDVGSGFSTYSKYEILKTDYIKIDRSVIENIQDSKANQVYLDHAIDLKKKTGVKVIAEGIETLKNTNMLKTLVLILCKATTLPNPTTNPFYKENR